MSNEEGAYGQQVKSAVREGALPNRRHRPLYAAGGRIFIFRRAGPLLRAGSSFSMMKRGCRILAFFARVGRDTADSVTLVMPRGLHRFVNKGWGKISFQAGAARKAKLIVQSALPPTLRKNREGWGSHCVVVSVEG